MDVLCFWIKGCVVLIFDERVFVFGLGNRCHNVVFLVGENKKGGTFTCFFLGLPFGDLLVETFEGQFLGKQHDPKE